MYVVLFFQKNSMINMLYIKKIKGSNPFFTTVDGLLELSLVYLYFFKKSSTILLQLLYCIRLFIILY